MKKREIIFGLLFPANEQATRTVEPRMRTLHDPSPCPIAWKANFLGFFFPSAADMIEIATRAHQQAHDQIIIACIQTKMLGMRLIWLRTSNHDAIQSGAQQFAVMAIGSIDSQGQRHACPISQHAPFGPALGAIGGIGAGRALPERGECRIAPSTACHSHWIPCTSS